MALNNLSQNSMLPTLFFWKEYNFLLLFKLNGTIALQTALASSITYPWICCINRFTSLCKNLFNLLEFLAEAFRSHVHHFQNLTVPLGLHWKWCTWLQKASAKISSELNKFLHSEANLLIQHIITHDQEGQNSNNQQLSNSWSFSSYL